MPENNSTSSLRVNLAAPTGALVVRVHDTFDWRAYQTRVVDLRLRAGENTIHFSNPAPGTFAPRIAHIEIALPWL
jgi:hypothetical protein